MDERILKSPQWTTGPRLLRSGEEIEFQFRLPVGMESGSVDIFPRYLERARPRETFRADGDLRWLQDLDAQRFHPEFVDGRASLTYRPRTPGNYLARWTAGDEVFHRYFSVVEDDSVVLRFSTFIELESEPTLHGTGIPLDYRLPVEQYVPGNPLFEKLLGYHRRFGDAVIPALPDTPPTGATADMTVDDRVRFYAQSLERVRALLPDTSDARSARVEMRHEIDPGYVEVFARLGLNGHFGLQEPNIAPWLGMPEFPYYASLTDFRKVNQEHGGPVVAHTWDFCGGFHFIGPATWHYAASEGDFEKAATCMRRGMDELKNLTEMSGHPAFANPLYDGATRNYGYPNGLFDEGYCDEPIRRFVDRWQRLVAFQFTREYNLVFARSIDVADFYRRHFAVTPRTVFVSRTDHPMYDMWWNCTWGREASLTTRERIPWQTKISTIMKQRRPGAYSVRYVNLLTGKEVTGSAAKDPLSTEHMLVEDQTRSIRFERESPNPIWWFDYTVQEQGPQGSEIRHVETPDVDIIRSEWCGDVDRTIRLRMVTRSEFADYAIALWGVPAESGLDRSRIKTNARDFVLAKNVEGEFHLVLFFDLRPDAELYVTLTGT